MSRKKQPWWVQRAHYLHEKRKPRPTLAMIALELDRTVAEVAEVLDFEERRTRARSAKLPPKSERRSHAVAATCSICGKPAKTFYPDRLVVCKSCRKVRFATRIKKTVELWNSGLNARDVAAALGDGDDPGTIGAILTIARQRGHEVRYATKEGAADVGSQNRSD